MTQGLGLKDILKKEGLDLLEVLVKKRVMIIMFKKAGNSWINCTLIFMDLNIKKIMAALNWSQLRDIKDQSISEERKKTISYEIMLMH